jgi:hypothetical protein
MNACDFRGKSVLDVGAGSGMYVILTLNCCNKKFNSLHILSFFARIAGAASVYSVEGSNVAEDMKVPPPFLFNFHYSLNLFPHHIFISF